MSRLHVLTWFLLATVAGCTSNHAALHPAGPRAQAIAFLLLIFCAVSTVVYLVVMAFLLWSLFRRRVAGNEAHRERKAWHVVSAAVGLTILTLITLALADFSVQRGLQAHPADAMRIVRDGASVLVGSRVRATPIPRNGSARRTRFTSPSNRPVELVLTSRDVIHSFWLPSLMGKKDLIPGYSNTEVAGGRSRPGVFTGQCAEFCGLQHAQMRLVVTAESPQDFERWRQAQLGRSRDTGERKSKSADRRFS